MHEIGHVCRPETLEPVDFSLIQRIQGELQKKGNLFLARLKTLASQDPILKAKKEYTQSVRPETFYPNWMKDKMFGELAIKERTAWAEALKMARGLEKSGFGVVSEFEDVDQVHNFINYSLARYEYNYRRVGDEFLWNSVSEKSPFLKGKAHTKLLGK